MQVCTLECHHISSDQAQKSWRPQIYPAEEQKNRFIELYEIHVSLFAAERTKGVIGWSYFAAVVFHERRRHVHVVTCARILSCLFENDPARFDALCPPGELHILGVDQRGVDVLDGQQLVIDAVHFLVLHATLRGRQKWDELRSPPTVYLVLVQNPMLTSS